MTHVGADSELFAKRKRDANSGIMVVAMRGSASDDPERHFADFICVCDTPGGEERRARAEALMAEVQERLARGSEELVPRPVDDSNMLTEVVFSLNWDFGAHISDIPNDQWSAVVAETYAKADDGEPEFSTYIECDRVEHGVAATWKAFADRFPEKLTRSA